MPDHVSVLMLWCAMCSAAESPAKVQAPVADSPFINEMHEAYSLGKQPAMNDVRAVAVDGAGAVWAATKAGVFRLARGTRKWSAAAGDSDSGPTFDLATDQKGTVWVAGWNGVYHSLGGRLQRIDGVSGPVAVLSATKAEIVAAGPNGLWRIRDNAAVREPLRCSRAIRDLLARPGGRLWLATDAGLYRCDTSECTRLATDAGLVSARTAALACGADGSLWVGGLGGVTVLKDGKCTAQFTPRNGLPSADVRCLCLGPDGVMWAGTPIGLARFDGRTWSLRHSSRWLINDDVRGLSFDSDGTAWIATAGGVSAIRRTRMTLAAKADHYQRICLARHVREPGLVGKCRLDTPGDVQSYKPLDDDNDGQYTAMYLAMESFRYAATKDPAARANARRAFEALRFLQVVTETPGFVARTVIPAAWTHMADRNRELSDRELAEQRVIDPRNKYVPVRWRPSRDGKWLWKGDTSSDEITGHFYGYLLYYDLAADEAQRAKVADHVRRIMDGIIRDGYVLKDIDGRHTRWAVWCPEKLNHDPDWQFERGINSVEILSFLKATHHMTGDEKYQKCYLELLGKHNYKANVLRPRSTDPAWRTHIDDELLALAYPALLLHETDPELKRLYQTSFDTWYPGCKMDRSPYFDFTYASLSGKKIDLRPAIRFLRDAPLDLVHWRVDSSVREDVRIVRVPELESRQTDHLSSVSERGVMRWDKNPWLDVQGEGGHTESDGVYWLLPYWMGRYYGYIQAPS